MELRWKCGDDCECGYYCAEQLRCNALEMCCRSRSLNLPEHDRKEIRAIESSADETMSEQTNVIASVSTSIKKSNTSFDIVIVALLFSGSL